MMNKSLQVNILSKMLGKHGLEPDLVDLEYEVDSTLSLDENSRIIRKSYGIAERESYGTVSVKKLENFLKAIEIFSSKSNNSQRIDTNKRAVKTFSRSELSDNNFDKWKRNSNRFDIEGVDSKG